MTEITLNEAQEQLTELSDRLQSEPEKQGKALKDTLKRPWARQEGLGDDFLDCVDTYALEHL